MMMIRAEPLFDSWLQLQPHSGSSKNGDAKKYQIWAGAELKAQALHLYFKVEVHSEPVSNVLEKIVFPEGTFAEKVPSRKIDLWKETCFECFIPSTDSTTYLEFNGAPNGNWNFYAFQNYRKGMSAFTISGEVPRLIALSRSEIGVVCEWQIPFTAIKQGFLSEFQELGLTVVLKTESETTYWALVHSGEKPDFHLRSSFIYPVKQIKETSS